MDPIERDLRDRLARESLSPREVRDGIAACFVLTNRQFIRRRLGDERPLAEIDAATRDLISQVFAEVGVSVSRPALSELRRAWHALDAQLGFEADPDLVEHHRQIIRRLLALANSS